MIVMQAQNYKSFDQPTNGNVIHKTKMNITLKTAKTMRYETVGDYYLIKDRRIIDIAEMPENYAKLVAFHELVEMWLCENAGITDKQIDEYDLAHPGEPGENADCPYRQQHSIASAFEKALASALGINWIEYETHLNTMEIKVMKNMMHDITKKGATKIGPGPFTKPSTGKSAIAHGQGLTSSPAGKLSPKKLAGVGKGK